MKIRLIKLMDRLLGGIAASALPSMPPSPVPLLRSALFIRPGGIGDAVLLLPAIGALKSAHPGCQVDVLAERRNAAVFGFSSAVRTVFCYDAVGGIPAALRGGYDLVVDTEQWYRLSAVVARLTGAAVSFGFATNERKRLFSHAVEYPQETYEACAFFRLLRPLGVTEPAAIGTPFLELSPAALRDAERLLQPLSGRPFVAIFPGASVPEKRWESEKFRELVSQLASRGMASVLVGGEDACSAAREIAAGNEVLDLVGRCSLAVSAAVVGKGRLLVSGDSGLLHIAVALGTPTVSFFGPSDAEKWAPKGENQVVLEAGLPCSPCSRFGNIPRCGNAGGCLSGITVTRVLDGLGKLLNERQV